MLEAVERTSALGWAGDYILHARHHDLSAGLEIRQIKVRVILLQQPDWQLIESLGHVPQGISFAHDVDLGADDPMLGEVSRLQLSMIFASLLLEVLARYAAELQLDAVADQDRFRE